MRAEELLFRPFCRVLLQKLGGEAGPAGLMAGTQARVIVRVEILVKPDHPGRAGADR